MKDPLRKLFEAKLKEWKEKKPEEHDTLLGSLMFYGSVVGKGKGTTLWEILKEQILFQAKEHKVKPSEFVEDLFESKNADIFMGRLQL